MPAMLVAALACTGPSVDLAEFQPPETPAELVSGQVAFNLNCARCHGIHAVGTDSGPPLVHQYYRPGHHGDPAFTLAVTQGVVAHHWRFGDMPAQPQIREGEIGQITRYIRWLQRSAGIE